jgi:hypothetical protein
VVEHEFIAVLLDHYKTHAVSRYFDVTRAVRLKTANKALTGAHGIKAPDTLQAFAHGLDSNGDEVVDVAVLSEH